MNYFNRPKVKDGLDAENKKTAPKENLFLNVACNLIVPSFTFMKLSGENYLGIKLAIITALLFPLIYGIRDFIVRKNLNFFSALGVISVLLTGGISLMELNASYIAIKEASIPSLLAIATLISLKSSKPVIRIFVEFVFEIELISEALEANGRGTEFETLLVNGSWILAGGFLISAVLNYVLATMILTAQPGTVEFNEQLGTMWALSFPVIALPVTLILVANLYYLLISIKRITGIPLEDLMKNKITN
ncbi:MAG: MFS transporter [Cellvibrionales bacterium TMED49]|nr:MFS transporter [Porticoccaceae bacterium]OUU39606.1 MAG: MFS transporter [Cellvibrionales bacterium TMED49]|tara:strand:- start:2410 stop:3153 length:744 start_codon:yes stop_codon:yes gene_type:complete